METAAVLSRLQKQCSKAEYCRADVYRKALKALEGDAEAMPPPLRGKKPRCRAGAP